MKCIFLCAGYATRLFPLTENFPKALLEVGGKPILDYTLDKVNKMDLVDEIYLVTNNKYAPHFEKWAKEKNNIKPITVFNDGTMSNDDRLGAIGDIQFTIEKAGINDDIFILATDNLFDFELKDFEDFYKKVKSPAVCVKKEDRETLKRIGVACLDSNNIITNFEEKPANPKGDFGVYAEYMYPKEVVPMVKEYLNEGNSCDAPGNFVKYLSEKMPTYAYVFDGECYDVGTHEALAKVRNMYDCK